MKISDIMTPCPYKVSGEKSLTEALKMMELRGISHLPVANGEEIVGVLSKRDLEVANFVCETTNFCPSVMDICRDEPYSVNIDTPVAQVTEDMGSKKTDYALVIDHQGNIVGIFTVTDACRLVTLLLNETE